MSLFDRLRYVWDRVRRRPWTARSLGKLGCPYCFGPEWRVTVNTAPYIHVPSNYVPSTDPNDRVETRSCLDCHGTWTRTYNLVTKTCVLTTEEPKPHWKRLF